MEGVGQAIRLIGAGLFVFFALLLSGLAAVHLFPGVPAAFVGIAAALLLFPLCGLAYLLFGERLHAGDAKSVSQQLSELSESGLLDTQHFSLTRVFEVQEAEDEGMHFFCELPGGAVLYLTGQYLYEYELDDSVDGAQRRRFPCSDFTIRRHSQERYVVDLSCRGHVLEPECVAPPFTDSTLEILGWPQDGHTWTDRPYDELKAAIAGAG